MYARSSSKLILSSPTGITPAAYASGDVIGAVTTLTNAMQNRGGTGILESICITDKTNTKQALDIIIFSEAPANSIGADNAAYGLNDADCGKVLGRISVATTDWISSGSNNAEATLRGLALMVMSKKDFVLGSKNLFYALVARGSITLASVTDLQMIFGFLQD